MDDDNKYKKLIKDGEIQEIPWYLIESYFNNKHLKQLIHHQIESFNYFTSIQIEETINMFILYILRLNMIILKNIIFID